MHVYLLIPVTFQGRPAEKAKGQKFAVLSLTDAIKRFNVSTTKKNEQAIFQQVTRSAFFSRRS
jgi:hypothetical protein